MTDRVSPRVKIERIKKIKSKKKEPPLLLGQACPRFIEFLQLKPCKNKLLRGNREQGAGNSL